MSKSNIDWDFFRFVSGFVITAVILIFAGFGIGYINGKLIDYEDCIRTVKGSYDIIDFDKSELDAKIKACEVLYHE